MNFALLFLLTSVASKPVCNVDFDPNKPLIPCCLLPPQFYTCSTIDCTSIDELDVLQAGDRVLTCATGCSRYGPDSSGFIQNSSARCEVVWGVDCLGSRIFVDDSYPCTKSNGHYFPTAILLSTFLGWIGADRLYLGHYALGVCKLLSIGGLGVWWLVDIIFLLIGRLLPQDGSSWETGM